ncbi:MAG TPA: hypothetical protein VFD70_28555 [Anaerolineae bacterium]|nr:hypothetical protein [Anaerolineae bacterium]
MLNERQLDLNPYLQERGESQLRAKHAFDRRAGWYYGFVVGALTVITAYGWDALQLLLLDAEFWWIHLALACLTIVPLAILIGGIGGYIHWLLRLPLWALFGALGAWCALHIPFDGAQLALQWFDSNLRVSEFLAIPPSIADSSRTLMILGAGLGVLVGFLHTIVVNWAWEYSSDENLLTVRGLLSFFLVAPLAFGLAFLLDSTAHAPLRTPLETIHATVQSGLNDAPGLDPNQMEGDRALVYLTGQRWRAQFTRNYTIHLAALESNSNGESFADVSFDNGFNWRCRLTSTGALKDPCYDISTEYRNYVVSFISHGTFQCIDCQGQVAAPADTWQVKNARELTATDQFLVKHGAGSIVTVEIQAQDGSTIECTLSGANSVIIQNCK